MARNWLNTIHQQTRIVVTAHDGSVPLFLFFGFVVGLEMLFGAGYAPSVAFLVGTGALYSYQMHKRTIEQASGAVKKKM